MGAIQQVLFSQKIVTPSSYLINQNFETPGTGYDNGETWTTSTGSPNPVYTPALLGTQSLNLNGSASSAGVNSPVITDASELYGYFLLNVISLPGAPREILRFLLNGAQASNSSIQLTSSGQLQITNGTTTSTATVSTMSLATTYHVFWHLLKGTGADGNGWVGFTSDGSIPTGNNLSNRNTMNGTVDFDQLRPFAQFSTSGSNIVMDRILLSTTAISANP